MTNEEKMAALLADVQKILDPLKGKDANALQVSKEIGKLFAEEKMKGLRVVKRFRVKFTADQWKLLSEAKTKEARVARRKAVVAINAALTKLLNAEVDAAEIKETMIKVLQSHKDVGAYNKTAEALLDEVIKVYTA